MAQRSGVVQRRLRSPVLRRPIGLVRLRNRSLSPAAQRMVEPLRTEIEAAGLGR
ncbi:MAG: hypothetical protein ACRYGA_14035 [Janthinobacterium lividum]